MESFYIAINAVVPFIIYIAFGYSVVRLNLTTEDFMRKVNAMVFKFFFPLLMFENFYSMNLSTGFDVPVILFVIIFFISLVILSLIIVPLIEKKNSRRGVIIQAIFRSNAILFAMPLAASVIGEDGKMLASVLVAFMVPFYNTLAIIILEYYNGSKPSAKTLAKKIITNPLIIGAIAGTIFVVAGISLPTCIQKPIKALADTATPLSLFVLGATIHFSSIKENAKALTYVIGLRLIVIPAIIILLTMLFRFNGTQRFVAYIMFGTPVAVSSYSMAANMGGDDQLAGGYVAFSTLISLFTVFGWIMFMKSTGLM